MTRLEASILTSAEIRELLISIIITDDTDLNDHAEDVFFQVLTNNQEKINKFNLNCNDYE